ncbi:hypothetical protein GO730_38085 [Spirosoma sp. HMF3257]|uniref:Uncharacterized protein n=1 Tax=Spirosoma telluris TaxID=2183553 RepID=A0A327ND81_9BACT|nr:hypothetical protein [Spirosoma telluris]MVM42131.1 hypothetical protein [Spirosoma telluris]RAI73046.1 hypothetical protein HMF3257_37215 [Spirosoma telluris]RAI73177.1 hypothetical protein HMF3257_37985 [Spirosoma telluris]
MESKIITAFKAYKDALAELATTLKNRVKASSSLKALKEELGLTANMYYQRLNYPQNIPADEIAAFAKLLNDKILIQLYEQTQTLGHQLSNEITDYIKEADLTITFVCKKLDTDPSSFYRKQKDPRLWSKEEVEKIAQIVETIKNL